VIPYLCSRCKPPPKHFFALPISTLLQTFQILPLVNFLYFFFLTWECGLAGCFIYLDGGIYVLPTPLSFARSGGGQLVQRHPPDYSFSLFFLMLECLFHLRLSFLPGDFLFITKHRQKSLLFFLFGCRFLFTRSSHFR